MRLDLAVRIVISRGYYSDQHWSLQSKGFNVRVHLALWYLTPVVLYDPVVDMSLTVDSFQLRKDENNRKKCKGNDIKELFHV